MSNLRRLKIGEEKEEDRKKEETTGQKTLSQKTSHLYNLL